MIGKGPCAGDQTEVSASFVARSLHFDGQRAFEAGLKQVDGMDEALSLSLSVCVIRCHVARRRQEDGPYAQVSSRPGHSDESVFEIKTFLLGKDTIGATDAMWILEKSLAPVARRPTPTPYCRDLVCWKSSP